MGLINKLQKIYDKSPIFIQNIFVNIYGLKAYCDRYTGEYYNYKKDFLARKNNDYNFELKYQQEEMIRLLNHCAKNSPYYSKQLKNYNFSSWEISDLQKLPFLTKEELRNNIDLITTTKECPSNTGGTTGKSLQVYFTLEDTKKRMAYLDAFKEKHGIKLGMRVARFSGKNLIPHTYNPKSGGKYWRTNWIIKQRLYSTFHMNDRTLDLYVKNLNKFKPKSLDGFITNIYQLAQYIEKKNLKLEFQLIAIFPTAETILPHHRELVERVFKCPIRDQYASSEGAPFITECTHGKLHYCMDSGIIELVNSNESLVGDIAVTSFTTYGTPLVRYLIGDTVEFSEEKCSCGCCFPVIKRIVGRNSDCLYSKERGIIHAANMSNVIKYFPNSVTNTQFIQKSEDCIEINIVFEKDSYKKEYDDTIIKEMKQRFGDKMTFTINVVNEIPREKSGKLRFIKNETKIN